jgi:hypothetical protein
MPDTIAPVGNAPQLTPAFVDTMSGMLDTVQREAERTGNFQQLDYVAKHRAILARAQVVAKVEKPAGPTPEEMQQRAEDRAVGLEHHAVTEYSLPRPTEGLPLEAAASAAAGLSAIHAHPTMADAILADLASGKPHDADKERQNHGADVYDQRIKDAAYALQKMPAGAIKTEIGKLPPYSLRMLAVQGALLRRTGR